MTTDPIVSVLEAELETGRALADTLERQRVALIERDVDQVNELSGILEGQFEHLNLLLQTRARAMADDGAITDRRAALVREVAHVEARMMDLAQLNQTLLADRLAYVTVVLGALAPDDAGAYSAPGGARRAVGALARSA